MLAELNTLNYWEISDVSPMIVAYDLSHHDDCEEDNDEMKWRQLKTR